MKKYFLNPKQLIALMLMLVLILSAMPVAFAESFSAYVYPTSMPVYSSKAMTKKLGSLPEYTVVKVLNFDGDLGAPVKIEYNGATGYALPRYMQAITDPEKMTVNADTKVYLKYKDAKSGVAVKAGTEVNVVLVKDGTALVERGGVGGFISTGYLTGEGWSPEEFTGAATPKPTAAPEATPVPDLSKAIPATVMSNTKVYAGKNNKTKYLGTVKKGVEVNVVDYGSTWAYIELDGNYGYCDITKLKKTSELATATPTVKPTATPTAKPTATPTAAPTAAPDLSKAIPATVMSTTKVYAGKNNKTKYLGTVKKGVEVNVVDYGATWAYIELDGNYGYCDITKLKKTSELATATPTVAPTATPDLDKAVPATVIVSKTGVYAGKSNKTKYLGSIKKGTEVNVIKTGDTWAYIERNGNYGYCDITALKKTSELATATPTVAPTATPDLSKAIPATVIADKVAVYAAKSESSKKLGTLKKGAELNMVEYYDGTFWCLVELDGKYGYCDIFALKETSKLTTPTPVPTATPKPDLSKAVPGMAVSNVKVYKEASTSSKYLGTLKKGKTVNVIKYDDNWAYIELSGNYGYCSVSALIPLLKVDEAAPGVVSAAKLDFYAAPSTSAKHLGRLSRGAKVNVLQVLDGWAYVEYKGNYGWCKVSGLAALEDPTPTPTADPMSGWTKEKIEATVVSASAQVWAGLGTGSTQNVALGTNLTVVAYNTKTGWAAVEYGKVTAYIKISSLSRSDFASLSNGSSGSAVSTLEKALLSMGYFDDNPDSTYNSYTAEAVRLFQAACGMNQTGTADAATQRVLFSGNAPTGSLLSGDYQKGDSGSNITRIQRRLYSLGYLSKTSSVDGDYGTNTYNAIKLFQECNGLEATGAANRPTLKKLYSTGAEKLPSGKKAGDAVNIVTPSTGSQTNNSTSISSTLKSTTSTLSSGASAAEKIEYMIYVAQNQLGKPYVYGASGTAKYDCSGFTSYCFKQVGVTLPRTAQSQGYSTAYSRINSVSDLKRGDLVFFNTVSDSDSCDHAGIYLGAGWFIHASSGQAKVVISNLASNYYNRVFSWAHRPVS